jgi:hypothetical protein
MSIFFNGKRKRTRPSVFVPNLITPHRGPTPAEITAAIEATFPVIPIAPGRVGVDITAAVLAQAQRGQP